MRNICRKFTAQFFTICLFCVIEEQQYHACYQTIFCDRVCQQLIASAITFHGHFFMIACQSCCNAASETFCTVQSKYVFFFRHMVYAKQTSCAFITGKNFAFCIQNQQPFLHIFSNGFKFTLSALTILHLFTDELILHSDTAQKRCHFIINFCLFGMFQIHIFQRFHNALGCFACQEACQDQCDHQNQSQQLCHGKENTQRTQAGNGQTQNSAITQFNRIVFCFFCQCGGVTCALTSAGFQSLNDFFTFPMIFHLGNISIRIKQNCTICINPCDSLALFW